MKYEPHCSADCFNWDLAGNFFFAALVCASPDSLVPELDVSAICEWDKSCCLVNETVPLVFLVSGKT